MSEQQKQHSPKAKSSYRVKVRNSLVDLVDLPEPHIWDHLTSEEELLFSSNIVIQSWLMVRYRRPGIFGFYRESAALITRCVLISSRSFLIIYAKEKKHQGYALKLNAADFVQISRPNLQGNHSVTIKWNFGELVLSLRSDQLALWYSRILQGLSSSSQNSNTNSPWFKNGNASKMMEVATQTDEEPLCSTPKTTFTADVASVTSEDKQQDPSEECNQSTICNTLREVSDSCLSKNKGILQPNATTLMSEQPNAVSPPTNLNSQTDLITAISKLKNRNSGKFQCDVEPPAFIVVKQYGFGFSTEEVCADESPVPAQRSTDSRPPLRFDINFRNNNVPLLDDSRLISTSQTLSTEMLNDRLKLIGRRKNSASALEYQPDSNGSIESTTNLINHDCNNAARTRSRSRRSAECLLYFSWCDDELTESSA